MAWTFPREMLHDIPVEAMSFRRDPTEELVPTKGGDVVSVDTGPTLWLGDWESPPLEELDFGRVRAWLDTLASLEAFYGYDKLREYPLTYKDSGWSGLFVGSDPFDGVCFISDAEDNNVELLLAGLPEDFVLTYGDYVAFDYGPSGVYRALHRVSSHSVASPSGEMTIEVRPHVRPGVLLSPTPEVYLYRPSCLMKIQPGTLREATDGNRHGHVSFTAGQTLRRF